MIGLECTSTSVSLFKEQFLRQVYPQVLELRVSGVVLRLERFVLRQVHVGFLLLVECLQVLLLFRWYGVVVSELPRFQYCLSISSEFSVQFGHMSMFPVDRCETSAMSISVSKAE
jgi:hypothetical protein